MYLVSIEIEESWHEVVLALATTGGVISETKDRKIKIIVSTNGFPGQDAKVELNFIEFVVTKTILKKILNDVYQLQYEVSNVVNDDNEEFSEEKPVKEEEGTSVIKKTDCRKKCRKPVKMAPETKNKK